MKTRLFLVLLMSTIFSGVEASARNQASICKRESRFTSNRDTGFYITFLDLVGQRKIVDDYTVFYHELSDDLEKKADQLCVAGKTNQEIIESLSDGCHSFCQTQGRSFAKSLGFLMGGHLVNECGDICAIRTNTNKAAFPNTSPSNQGPVETNGVKITGAGDAH